MNKTLRLGIITAIISFILAIIPLPDAFVEFRPEWVTLVLIYWTVAAPSKIGVTVAWFSGLILDVSYGTLIGQHAIGMVIVIYVIHLQHQRFRVASLLQQALVVLALIFVKQLLILWVDGMLGRETDSWLYFMPTITSALLWPWIHLILRDLHRKFGTKKQFQF